MKSTKAPRPKLPLLTRQEVFSTLLMALLGCLTILASFLYAQWSESGPVLCPLRLVTGLPCPACGLTRSFCAIAKGEWWHALAFHVLGPPLFLLLLLGIPLLLYQAITRRKNLPLHNLLYSQKVGFAFAAFLFSYHLVRVIGLAWSGALWVGVKTSLIGMLFR